MDGDIDEIIEKLQVAENAEKLNDEYDIVKSCRDRHAPSLRYERCIR